MDLTVDASSQAARQAQRPIGAGYVIPLHNNHQQPYSFVFAVTRWIPDSSALREWLPAIANFTTRDIPYRTDELQYVELDKNGLRQLPASMFARDIIVETDWPHFMPDEFLRACNARYGSTGHGGWLLGSILFVRSGPGDDMRNGLPEGENALWRNAGTTILIDLDDVFRQHAVTALCAIASPFNTAAAAYGTEAAILIDHGHKWDSVRGDFLSPNETLAQFQEERVAALDALGSTFFRVAIHSSRVPDARGELRQRAATNERTRLQQYREDRKVNLTLALAAEFSNRMRAMVTHVLNSPPRVPIPRGPPPSPEPPHPWADEFSSFFRELVRAIQARLNEETTRDYLGDPGWRRSAKHMDFDEAGDQAVPQRDPDDPTGRPIEEVLADRYGRELLARAEWTPTEKRVMVGIWANEFDTLEAWAIHYGMNPATARVHKRNALAKLEAAKKLL